MLVRRLQTSSLLATAAFALAGCAAGTAGSTAMQPGAQPSAEAREWREYAHQSGTRYSPLEQINASNVSRLQPAWEWEATQLLGEEREFRNQSTPLMVDGRLFFTAGQARSVIAADAKTGETLWTFTFDDPRNEIAPRANSGRGVSYWEDGDDKRILVVTPGFYLFALDAETGERIPSFGDNGSIDLKAVLGYPDDAVIGASSPPAVYQDVVMVGPALAVGLAPPSRENVRGSILAFDARTGAERWRFHTIPRGTEFGADTWEGGSEMYTGNAGAWAPITVDDERGIAYLPIEAATGDYYGGHRPGDNLFSSSLVAVNALTGERIWHFQMIHHDIFDWDNPTTPILGDVTVNGQRRPVVVQLTKQANAYVLDRVTGEPIWPIVERPVPQSDIPTEVSSPTQPFPTKPAPYDRQGFSEDVLIDFTPELRAEALEAIKPFRMGEFFTPASLADAPDGTQGTLTLPGTLGGTNWEGGSFDPETGMLYVSSHTTPAVLRLVSDPDRSDMDYIMAYGRVPSVQGLPLVKPPWNRVTAIDLNTGDHAWMTPAGNTPEEVRNNPALAGVDIGRTGGFSRPVLLTTATLLFMGEGGGGDNFLHVLDKRTGERITSIELPGEVTSIPMTYMVDGKQYVAFWVGTVPDVPSRLMVMALP